MKTYSEEYYKKQVRDIELDDCFVPRGRQMLLSFNNNLKLPEQEIKTWLVKGWTVDRTFHTANEVHIILGKKYSYTTRKEELTEMRMREEAEEQRHIERLEKWDANVSFDSLGAVQQHIKDIAKELREDVYEREERRERNKKIERFKKQEEKNNSYDD